MLTVFYALLIFLYGDGTRVQIRVNTQFGTFSDLPVSDGGERDHRHVEATHEGLLPLENNKISEAPGHDDTEDGKQNVEESSLDIHGIFSDA